MDERLEKALDFSNYMVSLYNQKKSFQEKFYQDIVYYYNGSQFTVTQGLISFCDTMLRNNQEEIVLIDDNDIPTEIENLKLFLEHILNIYFEASNSFINDYNRIKKQRTVANLTDT